MCTTEVWTYRHCGCRYNHRVRCHPSLEEGPYLGFDFGFEDDSDKENVSPNREGKTETDYDVSDCTISDTSSTIESSRGHNGIIARKTRHCSIRHVVNREFLEPICDECVLEEANILSAERNGSYMRLSSYDWNETYIHSDDNDRDSAFRASESTTDIVTQGSQGQEQELILESQIDIHIVDEDEDNPDQIHTVQGVDPQYLGDRESMQDRRTSFATESSNLDSRVRLKHDNDNDADDEGSLHVPTPTPLGSSPAAKTYDARGRLRTRSKEIRRRGMDIGREDLRLRIASGWSEGEKRGMEHFKAMLQEKPAPPLPTLPIVQGKDRSRGRVTCWAKGVAEKVGRSIGRSGSRVRRRKEVDGQSPEPINGTPTGPSAGGGRYQGDRVEEGSGVSDFVFARRAPHLSCEDRRMQTERDEEECPRTACVTSSSWDEHLNQDLGGKRRQKVLDIECHSKQTASKLREPIHDNEADDDAERRLLSTSSAVPSIPATISSITTSASWPRALETLRIASADFERDDLWDFTDADDTPSDTASDFQARETEPTSGEDGDVTSIDDRISTATQSSKEINESSVPHSQEYAASKKHPCASVDPMKPMYSQHEPDEHTKLPLVGAERTQSPSVQKGASRNRPPTPLSLHSLRTPLRPRTPVRAKPTPSRTSSLFSPPAGSPYRLLALPLSASPMGSGMRQSPTTAFVCVKERVFCGVRKGPEGVCGRKLGERLVSCVCKHGGQGGVWECESVNSVLKEVIGHVDAGEVCALCASRT